MREICDNFLLIFCLVFYSVCSPIIKIINVFAKLKNKLFRKYIKAFKQGNNINSQLLYHSNIYSPKKIF